MIQMKKIDIEAENARLKAENVALKIKNKNISHKLEKSKCRTGHLQKELKKKTYGQSF